MRIDSDLLNEKLKYISFGISKNSTDPPRTKAIRFATIDSILYAFANDGVNRVKVEICPSDSEFSAIVDYAQFSSVVKSCSGEIVLKLDDKGINLKTSIMKAKIPTYNTELNVELENKPFSSSIPIDNDLVGNLSLGLTKMIIDPTHPVEAYRKIYFGDNLMVSDTDNVLIVRNKIFNKDVMLNFSSVELLSNISEVKYTFVDEDASKSKEKISKLRIKSKELEASIIVSYNEDEDFQYNDLMALFDDVAGSSIELDTKTFAKAVSASQLFKREPILIFDDSGIRLDIPSSEFSYRISTEACDNRAFILTPDVSKKIIALGDEVKCYYSNEGLIRCDFEGVSEILSIKEVSEDE